MNRACKRLARACGQSPHEVNRWLTRALAAPADTPPQVDAVQDAFRWLDRNCKLHPQDLKKAGARLFRVEPGQEPVVNVCFPEALQAARKALLDVLAARYEARL